MKKFLYEKKIAIILGIILFYVIYIILSDVNTIAYQFSKMEIILIPLILVSSFCVLLSKGIRQYLLLKNLGLDIGIKDNYTIFFAGLTMLVTPGGIGEVIKSYYLKKSHGHNMRKTFPFVLMERAHDLLAVVTIISIILFFVELNEAKILVIGAWIIFILGFILLRRKSTFDRLISLMGKIKKFKNFSIKLSESYESLNILLQPKIILKSWCISILSWVLTAVSYYLCFKAFNMEIEGMVSILFTFTSIAFGALSFLPGGVGVTELSLTGLLTREGFEIGITTSVVLLIRLTGTWFATAVGFLATKSALNLRKNNAS